MRRMAMMTALLALSTMAWAQSAAKTPAPAEPSAAPGGARLVVQLDQSLSTKKAKVGDAWTGVLVRDAHVGDIDVAQVGDEIKGVVIESASGHGSTPARLSLRVTELNGRKVATNVVTFRSDLRPMRTRRYDYGYGYPGGGAYVVDDPPMDTVTGATAGAAVGGIVGAVASGTPGGALAGLLIGGVAGGVLGHHVSKTQVGAPVETVVIFTTIGKRPGEETMTQPAARPDDRPADEIDQPAAENPEKAVEPPAAPEQKPVVDHGGDAPEPPAVIDDDDEENAPPRNRK